MVANWGEIQSGQKQLIGTRPLLEDCVASERIDTAGGMTLELAIVADGIGGENAGERAARLTVETVLRVVRESRESDIPRVLERSLKEANGKVFEAMRAFDRQHDMGCTAVVLAIAGRRLFMANVGDSRAYLIRGDQITQLTVDHTWGNDMLRAGKRTEEELRNHPSRDKLTRSIGYEPTLNVDLGIWLAPKQTEDVARRNQGLLLQPGDHVIACSDGLIKETSRAPGHFVEPREIIETVRRLEPERAALDLAERAVSRMRGREGDNVSVIVLGIPGNGNHIAEVSPDRTILSSKSGVAFILGGLAFLALVALVLGSEFVRPSSRAAVATPTIPPLEGDFAYVSELTGIVNYQPPGGLQSTELEVGQQVEAGAGSLLTVIGAGRLRVGLANGSVVFLDGQTQIELRQIGGRGTSSPETQIQLVYGRMLASVSTSSSAEFVVRSRNGDQARAAGTLYGTEFDRATGRFDLDCLEGHCLLLDRMGRSLMLKGGEHSLVVGTDQPIPADGARYERYIGLGDPGLVPTPTPLPTRTPAPTPTHRRVVPYGGGFVWHDRFNDRETEREAVNNKVLGPASAAMTSLVLLILLVAAQSKGRMPRRVAHGFGAIGRHASFIAGAMTLLLISVLFLTSCK